MTDEDTQRVRAYETDAKRINDMKRGDDNQADVIRRLLDAEGHDGPTVDMEEGRVLSEDTIDELVEEFAVAVEPEQGMVDDAEVARAVAAQIDYVELANKVADEVEGRLR